MSLKNTPERYGSVAIILHWMIALLIVALLIVGLVMVRMPTSLLKLQLYGWHKELGMLTLALVGVRIFWRLINLSPVLPTHMPRWQRFAAVSAHYVFYSLMLAIPITGWLMTSSAGMPVSFFGLFIIPNLTQANQHMHLYELIHEYLSYGLIALLCAHMGAALQHHFYYKDDILRRMLPP